MMWGFNDGMEAQANQLGIPMQISITDDVRHHDCDARVADLVALEDNNKIAVYKGECNVGHNYETRLEVHELQQQARIENGELKFGSDKGFDGGKLEEF